MAGGKGFFSRHVESLEGRTEGSSEAGLDQLRVRPLDLQVRMPPAGTGVNQAQLDPLEDLPPSPQAFTDEGLFGCLSPG